MGWRKKQHMTKDGHFKKKAAVLVHRKIRKSKPHNTFYEEKA